MLEAISSSYNKSHPNFFLHELSMTGTVYYLMQQYQRSMPLMPCLLKDMLAIFIRLPHSLRTLVGEMAATHFSYEQQKHFL